MKLGQDGRCTKILHFTKADADEHAAEMRAKGFPDSYSYKCKHCPFWHTTSGGGKTEAKKPWKPRAYKGGRSDRKKARESRLRAERDHQ